MDQERALRLAYEEFPEQELDSDDLPRYVVGTAPDTLLTPKEAAGLTGWNPHTVRVRIARNRVAQRGWLVSPLGWKSGLYDRDALLAVLKR